VYKINYSTTSK